MIRPISPELEYKEYQQLVELLRCNKAVLWPYYIKDYIKQNLKIKYNPNFITQKNEFN